MNDSATLARRAAVAFFGAALFVPTVASANTLPGPADFAECLDGARVSGENVAPGAMDHDPLADEVVLDFADSLSDAEAKAIAARYGLTVSLNSVHSDDANVYIARVAEGAVPHVIACLENSADAGSIEGMEENVDYSLFCEGSCDFSQVLETFDTKPNDPLYQYQWHFDQVNAEAAWRVSTGKDVTVAVIDTGVAVADHKAKGIKKAKDLEGTGITPGYDFVDNSSFVFDGHGHGTHVAGTIAQTTNNKYGVAGLAYNANIMGLRVLNSRGFGQVSDIADAVRFAADNKAQVINMSLGGPLPSLVLKRAIDYAHKKGVTVVAAAGNGGKRAASYPASYDHVISVAATQYDKKTTFYSQWHPSVDIAAPGGNTRVDQNKDGRPDGVLQQTVKPGKLDQHDFLLYMGTSMASPHVAAGAALVIAQGVTHPDKVEAILKKTADTTDPSKADSRKYSERFGAGLMQADAAVKKANTEQGTFRFVGGLFLALLALGTARRRDPLGLTSAKGSTVVATSTVVASGLFFLPLLFGDAAIVEVLSRPLAEWDILLFGFDTHQSPLFASAAIPLAATALLSGNDKTRGLAIGVALGMAGFLLTESYLLTSDVRVIPGIGALDRVWLAANGLLSLGLGYVGLKRY